MKNISFIIIAAAIVLAACYSSAFATNGIGRQYGYPANPNVSSSTTPPTSIRSGLIRRPQPYYTAGGISGNLIITGNVRGGKHFRGIVPYGSTSDFRAPLGTADLFPFLRDSAAVNYSPRKVSRGIQPYYLPSRTVTSLRRGSGSGLRQPDIRLNKGTGDFVLPSLAKIISRQPPRPIDSSFRPFAKTLEELEKSLSPWMPIQTREREKDRKEPPKGRLPEDLLKVKDRTELVDKTLQPPKPFEPLTLEKFQERLEERPPDIYQKMQEQIQQNLQKRLEELGKSRQIQEANQPAPAQQAEQSPLEPTLLKIILGSHKTFAAITEDKFNSYMKAAEEHMKQGRYYRAADAYTLANIYKPNDPLPLAGKAHALFAAGEYMSSALFLSLAIEIFPEYTHFKIDIPEMIPDRDKLESRIVDIVEWLEKTGSGELHFLLAYVYYQLDKLELAGEAIDAALKKMPDGSSVLALKKAIDNAIATAQQAGQI